MQKLIAEYYKTGGNSFPQNLIDDLQSTNLPLQEKIDNFSRHHKLINELETLFKKIVRARNKLAVTHQFPNFFDYQARLNGITDRQLTTLKQDSGQNLCRKIQKCITLPNSVPDGFWSEYNIPSLYDLSISVIPENLSPDKVIADLISLGLLTSEQLSRIKIHRTRNYTPYADYHPRKKTVSIKLPNRERLDDAILVAHEFGHATSYLGLMDRGVNVESMPNTWHEMQAFEFESNWIQTLPKKLQMICPERILYFHLRNYFEFQIYNHPESNYAEIYADAHNKFYWGQQTSNPFYTLDTFFIDEPCYSAVYVATNQLLNEPHGSRHEPTANTFGSD